MAYNWWLFLHLVGVFGFLIAHGVSVAVTFRLRHERDRERIAALLELSARSIAWMGISLVVLLVAGVILGFVIQAWGRGWIWTALLLLIAVAGAMTPLAARYYGRIRAAVTVRRGEGYLTSDEELEDILRSGRPWAIAAIGFGGLAAILYLMVFKPF